jgi:hypothetical protein
MVANGENQESILASHLGRIYQVLARWSFMQDLTSDLWDLAYTYKIKILMMGSPLPVVAGNGLPVTLPVTVRYRLQSFVI